MKTHCSICVHRTTTKKVKVLKIKIFVPFIMKTRCEKWIDLHACNDDETDEYKTDILFRPESTGQSDPIRMFWRILFVSISYYYSEYTRASASISQQMHPIENEKCPCEKKKRKKKIFKNKGKRKREQFAQKEESVCGIVSEWEGGLKKTRDRTMVAERVDDRWADLAALVIIHTCEMHWIRL